MSSGEQESSKGTDPSSSKWRKFHRKKVTENVSEADEFFTKTYNPDATRDQGLWCRSCRKRVPWKDLNTDYTYDRKRDSTFRQWWCGYCSNLIREDDMTDLSMVLLDEG